MKKIFFLILVFTLALSLTACAGSGTGNPDGGNVAKDPQELLAGDIRGEITVTAFESMTQRTFLEEAARLFEEKYPGTKVNVETFSAMPEIKSAEQGGMRMQAIQMIDDPAARTDYISKVSASLMSGTGADILAVDVLPLYKFVESGQLVDLQTLMESDEDFKRSDYRENILDALTYKNGLWYVPLDYSFEYYTYDNTLMHRKEAPFGFDHAYTTQELIELAAPKFGGTEKIFNMSSYVRGGGGGGMGMVNGLYARMLREQYSTLVDIENRQAHFTDGGFVQLLNSVKEYEQLGYVNEGFSARSDPGDFMRGADGPPQPTERFFFKPKNNMSLQQQFSRNTGRRMGVMFMDASSTIGIEEDDEIAGAQADAKGQVPFTFQYGYAINAKSKNQATAWAFLKFLLSEEMQLSGGLNSMTLPLHNAAREQKAELLMSGALMGRGLGAAQYGGQVRQPGGQPGQQPGDQPGGQQAEQPGGQPGGQPGQQPGGQQGEQPGGQQGEQPGEQPGEQSGEVSVGQFGEEPLDEVQQQALDQFKEATEGLSDQISTYLIRDIVIDDMINTEVQYFFDGVKSAEDVAAALQNKVSLYLNE
jgi:ABC-type glycerol-3-phosphate transport system substrate-binding protein